MKLRQYRLSFLILLFLFQYFFVAWCANHPEGVELYYSRGIYATSLGIRLFLLQKIPFSLGDLLYILSLLLLAVYVYRNRKEFTVNLKKLSYNVLFGINLLYFIFHLSWGMNYHRLPLEKKKGYPSSYTVDELEESLCFFINEANRLQHILGFKSNQRVTTKLSLKELKLLLHETYATSPTLYAKNSLFSTMLSYMGYGGYLNPFTLEAQVNHKLPKINALVTMAHELSHQKGYAAENEANFIGFLSCQQNPNQYIQYGSTLFALRYLYSEMYKADTERARIALNNVNLGVLSNIKEASTFWQKYKNPLAPYFQKSYNQYLKANRQKKGIQSYNEVAGLILQDYKEHIKIE